MKLKKKMLRKKKKNNMSTTELTKLKIQMQKFEDGLGNLQQKVDTGFNDLKDLILQLSNKQTQDTIKLYDEMKSNYSRKWVEKVLIWAGGIVGAIFLTSAIYIVFSNGLK